MSGGEDHTLRVWDLEKGWEVVQLTMISSITSLSVSDEGGRVVSGDDDGNVDVLRLCNV